MFSATQVRRRYYLIVLLYNTAAALIWGVNTLFLLDAGLDLFQTFVANAFFTAGMVIFEIPTGVAADTVGRRFSFLASLVILAVSTMAYVWIAESGVGAGDWGLIAFSLASIFLGLGFTFYSGAVEAWVVDALNATGSTEKLDSVFARGGQMMGLSMLIGTISGGLLGQIHLSLPYVVRSWLLLMLFAIAFWGMHDIGFEKRAFQWRHVPAEMKRIVSASLDDGWHRRTVKPLMLMNVLFMGFLIWGWYAWQRYFLDLLGQELVWVAGVIAAILSLTMIGGAQLATVLAKRFRRSSVIITMSVVFSGAMIITGITGNFWIAVSAFLIGILGFSTLDPMRAAALHELIPSKTRATVISFGSLLSSGGGVVSQPLLGAYTRAVGIGPGYVIGGIVTAPAIFLALALRRNKQADGMTPRDGLDQLPGTPRDLAD